MPQAHFFGLDLTSSPRKPSACVGLGKQLDLIFASFIGSDPDILAAVRIYHPDIVAIDAPLTLPQGLCCLEKSCACQSEESGRDCERRLAKLGIPCYFTTKRSIIKPMVYRGIKLRATLEDQGYRVIEVYPYASKVRLWGKGIPSKLKPAGIKLLQHHLATIIPSLASQVANFNHDLCDAAMAAYTAYLDSLGKTEPLGNPEEGIIFIPI